MIDAVVEHFKRFLRDPREMPIKWHQVPPYTIHKTQYTLHPTLYTLHPTPVRNAHQVAPGPNPKLTPTQYTIHPTPYTLHSTPVRNAHQVALGPNPKLNPTPYTLHSTPYTLLSTPYTLHPREMPIKWHQVPTLSLPLNPTP